MMRWRRLACLLLLLAMPATARGAAWTQQEGHGLFIGATTFTAARQAFQGGQTVGIPAFAKVESALYVEYGLTDGLTLLAQPSLRYTHVGGDFADDFQGFGYADLGARQRLWQGGGSVLSMQGVVRVPGATDGRRVAQIGNTDAEIDLRLLFGHGFTLGTMGAFVNAEAAYRIRFDDPPSEFRLDLTAGLRPIPRWLVLAQSFTVVSNGAGRGPFPAYWYTKAQLAAVYEIGDGWSVQAGAVMTYAGDNALREIGGLVGLWWQF